MKKKEKSDVNELTDKALEKTSGGSYKDGGCNRYKDKPGTHMLDDYGHCYACIYNRGNRCELEK